MLFNNIKRTHKQISRQFIAKFVDFSKFLKKLAMPKKQQVHAELVASNHKVTVNVALICFQEGKNHIVYCPALELSGYGSSEDEAKKSFETVLEEYVRYATNKKTLEKDLQKRGWAVKKRKVVAPAMSEILKDNKDFQDIFDRHAFKKVDAPLEFPALAFC